MCCKCTNRIPRQITGSEKKSVQFQQFSVFQPDDFFCCHWWIVLISCLNSKCAVFARMKETYRICRFVKDLKALESIELMLFCDKSLKGKTSNKFTAGNIAWQNSLPALTRVIDLTYSCCMLMNIRKSSAEMCVSEHRDNNLKEMKKHLQQHWGEHANDQWIPRMVLQPAQSYSHLHVWNVFRRRQLWQRW